MRKFGSEANRGLWVFKRLSKTIQDHTEPYKTIRDLRGPHKTIWDHTGPNKTIRDQMGP